MKRMHKQSHEEKKMAQKAKKQNELDYTELGLKCGLEIHQQLDTERKLFCHCLPELQQDDPKTTIVRYMRPTLSELGKYDSAALMEFKKQKKIVYELYNSVCTYELDETPPFAPDPTAIDLAITISKLLQMSVLDEIHVNRKQYLDGSIPAGFQRTMIIGIGGEVTVADRTFKLDLLALEEDSCREVKDVADRIIWRVDRLGIPLVEIATKTHAVDDPQEILELAKTLGRILRATGKVKRGLGTIRQDLNVSITRGARVELKGVQILDMIPEYIRQEVVRQLSLLEIRNELKNRKLTPEVFNSEKAKGCQTIFKKTSSKFLKEALKKKHEFLGLKLPNMKGLLGKKIQGEQSFGKELADRVKIITGLGGIIHTDELPGYGITPAEVKALNDFFSTEAQDAVVLVVGEEDKATKAIEEIVIRIKEAFQGVPLETRHANEDGTSRFERYLGGERRMYPDTDSKPIVITERRIQKIEENLPELPSLREQRYQEKYGLPETIAKDLAISPQAPLFDQLVKKGADPMVTVVALEQTLKALERDNIPIENLSESKIKEIFDLLLAGKVAKEAIEPLFTYFAKNPKAKMETALEELGLKTLDEKELAIIIASVLEENISDIQEQGTQAFNKLMGLVMDQVRGKVDGKIVNEQLREQLDAKVKELKIEEE
ncbi:MAG: Glu-tRNA(Gln) amidotransferase subunit GatE [Candidatus Heimdallarchaeota archaeon]|nr:Glu-tRNA(Gln) amidotransferase subunit GatE [Candidatus Heimdallarchaeota archaeon]